jgi:hypothetical protein
MSFPRLCFLSQQRVVLLQQEFLQSNEFKAVLESTVVVLRSVGAGCTDIPRDTRAIVVEGTPDYHQSPPLRELENEYTNDLASALPPDHSPTGTQVIVDFSGLCGVHLEPTDQCKVGAPIGDD